MVVGGKVTGWLAPACPARSLNRRRAPFAGGSSSREAVSTLSKRTANAMTGRVPRQDQSVHRDIRTRALLPTPSTQHFQAKSKQRLQPQRATPQPSATTARWSICFWLASALDLVSWRLPKTAASNFQIAATCRMDFRRVLNADAP